MQDVGLMEGTEGVYELSEEIEGSFLRERGLLSEKVFESSSFAILVDEVDELAAFDHFYKLDNIEVILEVSEGIYFVACELGEFGMRLEE
jgi:hypothetical protein